MQQSSKLAVPQELEKFLSNADAEACMIGAMILNKDVCSEVLATVSEDDIYDDFNRNVFRVIKQMFADGRGIDEITIANELKPVYAGGDLSARIIEFVEKTPNPMSAGYYARIVKERSIVRKLVLSCQSIITEVMRSKGADPVELLNYAQQEVLRITEQKASSPIKSVNELLAETFSEILRDRDHALLGIPTGFHEVDEMIGGLQNGSMYVIAGRPGMGKTSLALRIALSVSQLDTPVPVLIVSLEMPRSVITQQLLCIQSKVNAHRLRKGMLSGEEQGILALNAGKLSECPIDIDDSSDLSVYDLRVRCRGWYSRVKRDMKDKFKTAVVIVDYLQLLTAKGRYNESRQIEISTISNNLKAIAKELNVPLIAVAQLNRSAEHREGNKPMLADLRESGTIEQDADVVALIYREEVYKPDTDKKNLCTLTIAKNRLGPTGEVELVFLKEFTRFENLARID